MDDDDDDDDDDYVDDLLEDHIRDAWVLFLLTCHHANDAPLFGLSACESTGDQLVSERVLLMSRWVGLDLRRM